MVIYPFIVDLPIKNGGSFHSFLYVYQRVTTIGAAFHRDKPWVYGDTTDTMGILWGYLGDTMEDISQGYCR